jgi:hypothetical protein
MQHFYDVVEVETVKKGGPKKQATSIVEPLKKIGFLASFFNQV